MTDNKYPTDESDRLADAQAIRGTHKCKESNLRWWLAPVVIVTLAPTAGWAISDYIGSSEGEPTPTASVKETPSGTSNGASPTTGPSGDPNSSGGNKSSESGKPNENPSTDVSATPLGQENSTSADAGAGRPILVLSGSGKPGLAAAREQKLEKAGYAKVSANNYSGGNPAVSTVFYTKVSDAQAAKQVATTLGIRPGNVILAPRATGGDQIVVVLHADAR